MFALSVYMSCKHHLLHLVCLSFRFSSGIPQCNNLNTIFFDIVDNLVKAIDHNVTILFWAIGQIRFYLTNKRVLFQ